MEATVRFVLACCAAGAVLAPSLLAAAAEAPELKVGDKAPVFQAKDDAGNVWKSKDHVGKQIVVVYFYPAAMTGGCTKQACGFRDARKDLTDLGVEVVGISGDAVEGLAAFKKANDLNFPLLSDEKGDIARKFGVPVKEGGSIQRQIDGQEVTLTRGVTASRWTFVIDRKGRIADRDTQVQAANDSQRVLEIVKALK